MPWCNSNIKKYRAKVYFEVDVDDKEVNRFIDYLKRILLFREKGVKYCLAN